MYTSFDPRNADSARQAIHAIRGYEYQILAAALEWVDLKEDDLLYLEVTEDYARVIKEKIEAVQVKDTRGSGSITLNSPAVRKAIESFVSLVEQNPRHNVRFRYMTTSKIGPEKSPVDRPTSIPGLEYWRLVRSKNDVTPLRKILEGESNAESVRRFCQSRTDEELVTDLIHKITWDCNRPNAAFLYEALQERSKLFLQKNFGIPAVEARHFADVLAFQVLQRCTLLEAQQRVLTNPELHLLADVATRISLPRKVFENLLKRSLEAPVRTRDDVGSITTQSLEHPSWLGNDDSLATPKVLIRRESLEDLIQSALKNFGICFVVGSTGTGKSVLARSTTNKLSDNRYWVDLRDIGAPAASNRLKYVFTLLADLGRATLSLEDLNCLSHSSVQMALNEVVEAARRKDVRIVVTCYAHPTATTLNTLGVDTKCVVHVPNFTEEETHALVETLGGNSKIWGRVAFLAGGLGHPQLTYAFIAGINARHWPTQEIKDILTQGFTNDDLEEELRAARANLFNSMPKPARDLLHRLSITIAPFERTLAVEIGALAPAIEGASESFDELADRWLEPASGGRYRKSPLVYGLGKKMLTAVQQREVHEKIANVLSNQDPMNASEFETILVHGLAGESTSSLSRVACAIYMADEQMRQTMAKHLTAFLAFDTSKPVYAKDPSTSVLLRIAQLRLVVETEERCGIADIAEALLKETSSLPNEQERKDLEIAVLWFILSNQGIANDVDNWVCLLVRFRRLSDELEGVVMGAFEISPAAALFSFGIIGLGSVKRLETIVRDLSELDATQRNELLTPVDSKFDVSQLLVDHPLNKDSNRPDFDATEAVKSYKRIASETDSWGNPKLSILCRIVKARIMAEHLSDSNGALSVLQQAESTFGNSPLLDRANAIICRRSGGNSEALLHFGKAIEQIETFGPVDAVYMARDAAICAAELEEWIKAREWFLLAQSRTTPMSVLDGGATRVGFGADAAVASFRAGDLNGALRLLMDALQSLQEIESDANLQAAHCHRSVRYAIFWMWAKVDKFGTGLAVPPPDIPAGACSNPEPIPEIEQHPLGHIEFAWYLLSEIEFFSNLNVGVKEIVKQFGDKGYIPIPENMFRTQTLEIAITLSDPEDFSAHFASYLSSASYCLANQNAIRSSFSALNPQRVVFPPLPKAGPHDEKTEHLANNAILFYGFRSVFRGCRNSIKPLRDRLILEFGDSFPGCELLDHLNGANNKINDPSHGIATILKSLLESKHAHPILVFRAGVFLPKWIAKSTFKFVLISQLKPWLIEEWKRIVSNQRFLLRSPATSIPPIMRALNSELDGERFAAQLTLASESAVGASLDEDTRQYLRDVVDGS